MGGKLAIALLQPFESASHLQSLLIKIRRETNDHHLLYSVLGQELGFLPEQTMKIAFISIWVQAFPAEANNICEKVAAVCTA